jgi:hypothetical protein
VGCILVGLSMILKYVNKKASSQKAEKMESTSSQFQLAFSTGQYDLLFIYQKTYNICNNE